MERALIRLQVLTPLSLLLAIASLLCSTVASPNIAAIARLHPTSLTPNINVVEAYIGAIWLAQIAYCVGLASVLGLREETKRAAVKGVGLWLVSANIVLALWGIAWVTQRFLYATVLQALLLLLLFFSNLSLLFFHLPATAIAHPFNTLLIHAPLRFFFLLPLHILLPVSLFITLGFSYPPQDSAKWHTMPAFFILLGTHLLSLSVVVIRRDLIWCLGATWAAMSIWSAKPKPALVYIAALTFTVLHPLGLITSVVYHFFSKREGRIVLPPDAEADLGGARPGLYVAQGVPRETPEEALGGDHVGVQRSDDV